MIRWRCSGLRRHFDLLSSKDQRSRGFYHEATYCYVTLYYNRLYIYTMQQVYVTICGKNDLLGGGLSAFLVFKLNYLHQRKKPQI